MKSLIAFLQVILRELGIRCGTSTNQDLKTILARYEHEGLSFLTITLSNFGKDFQKSLDQGFVAPTQFEGFTFKGGLPLFLGGFLELVFDRKSARLLDKPSIEAIRAIRQLTLMFAKIDLPCSRKRERKALARYVEIEKDVRSHDQEASAEDNYLLSDFARLGRLLWADIFSSVDTRIYSGDVLPKHGTGSTADRLSGNRKWDNAVWTQRLESVFPFWEFSLASPRFIHRADDVVYLSPGAEIPAKVITVPKTLKTPRIIAMEPTHMQYMQQGLLGLIVDEMRKDDNSRNFVLSDSQDPNRELAKKGSLDGSLATLDLSEASDRVSNQHVRALVANHRQLRLAVDATRTRKADVDGHGVIRLAKYASMGSALCFPMEAFVFCTVVFAGIEDGLNRRLTKKDIKSFYGRVRVYGDDIIVPVEYVQPVLRKLQAFGFVVNTDKSYWTGRFRESCGKEYYDGHDVSIARVRRTFPETKQHASEIVSIVSLRNQLFQLGYDDAVEFLDNRIRKLIPFPIVEDTSSLLGRLSFGPSQPEAWDDNLHLPLVKGVKIVTRSPVSILDDHGALMKWFLKRGDEPFVDKDHLTYAGRARSVRIKTSWAPPR